MMGLIITIVIVSFALIVVLIFAVRKILKSPSKKYKVRYHSVKEKRKEYHPHIVYGKKLVDKENGERYLKSVPTTHNSKFVVEGRKPLKLRRNVQENFKSMSKKGRTHGKKNESYVVFKKYVDSEKKYSPVKKAIQFRKEMSKS